MQGEGNNAEWSVVNEHESGAETKPAILVVDDAVVVREEMRRIIPTNEFQIVEAADGAEGFSKVHSVANLVMVFLDVNMPFMDGITMAEKVAEEVKAGKLAKVPIVMLTTENTKDLVLRAKKAGVAGWIIKPPQKGVVQQIIQRLVPAKAS